jgi:hypothetical protein
MTTYLKTLLGVTLLPLTVFAMEVPTATSHIQKNLDNYLTYQTEGTIDFTCKKDKTFYICESHDQKISDTDEDNVTSVVRFKNVTLRFSDRINAVLEQKSFDKTMHELKASNKRLEKDDDMPFDRPLQDQLDRELAANLKQVNIDHLDITNSDPKSHVSVENIRYNNEMKKGAKGVTFEEAILGNVTLRYTNALLDTNDSGSIYMYLPTMLEEEFETDNSTRADYVGTQLHQLYKQQLLAPMSGTITLKSHYLGNDAISLDLHADSHSDQSSGSYHFLGELRNASVIFAIANKPATDGIPDFLFKSLHIKNSNDTKSYRQLLKKDKRFAKYIGEYDQLLRRYFDESIKEYTVNPVILSWFKSAKTAFSDMLLGKTETLDIKISNKNAATAMQLFGMVMGQMMALPADKDAAQKQQSKIILDAAAQNFDVSIKAY